MLKHLYAVRRRLDERRRYEHLLATLERINATDIGDTDGLVRPRDSAQRAARDGRR